MKSSFRIPEPILFDHKRFSRQEMLDYAQSQSENPDLEEWERELMLFIAVFLDESLKSFSLTTSGSTGQAKVFDFSREAICSSARRSLDFFRLQAGERAFLCLPIRYVAGKMMLVRAFMGQLELLPAEPSGRPLKGLAEHVDFAAMVPLQVHESLQAGDPLHMISKLLIGGGRLDEGLQKELRKRELPLAYESFGMTETLGHFALRKINGAQPESRFSLMNGVRAGIDQRSCIRVDIPGLTRGWLETNDLVDWDPDSNSFRWLGRHDHVLKSGGIKIIPEVVEEIARSCTGRDCLLLDEADARLGQRLVLLVESEADDAALEAWTDCLQQQLNRYEMPRRILCVPELPRNASMKPDRTRARNQLL